MFSRVSGIVCGLVCVSAGAWGQYVIQTVAGEGPPASPGYSGDNGPPASAQLYLPLGLAYANGTLYIADSANHCIRMIAAGVITTFAGVCGTSGYSGDGAAATLANLNTPSGVAVDPHGDVLIADTNNDVVRIVVPSGIISTFAGNHSPGFTGDGGPAIDGQLNAPTAIASDTAGNIYVTDAVNGLVRKINAVQQCTTPVTGTPVCGNFFSTPIGIGATGGSLLHPNGLAIDPTFAIYVSDTSHRVQKFANGTLSVYAGTGNIGFSGDGGPATKAVLNNPVGLTLDAAGNLYIADSNAFRIRVVSPNGIISTVAGSSHDGYSGDGGPALSAQMDFPQGVLSDGLGNIYIADTSNNVIRELTIPGPAIVSNGVVSSASFQPKISPGSLASIAGSNLATSTTPASGAPLPTRYGEASVSVNGKAAPILYASPSQINFQVPWETATGNASVTVTVDGVTSNTASVPVTAAAPGIFFNSSGAAIAQNHDYSLNSPSNPAHVGSYLIAYLTGSGPVTPAVADGAATPSTGLVQPTLTPTVTIGGAPATVLGAALTSGFVSLLQLNISVPSGLAAGSYPMIVTIGGQVSNSATVSIAP
jgi:trimeric autotransporter adhesin